MAFVTGSNITCSLGFTTKDVVEKLKRGDSGVSTCNNPAIYHEPFVASQINWENVPIHKGYTKLESGLILSVKNAIQGSNIDITNKETAIVFSTTKGNIDLLLQDSGFEKERVYLANTANQLGGYFNNPNSVYTISNACVSGVLAVNFAKDLIELGRYKNVVVVGGDLLSKFTVSGFQSFKAISSKPCKPYDINRDGINLGEAFATIVLSKDANHYSNVKITGGGTSGDANHISGPSRTGDGLKNAADTALNEAGVKPNEIDFISAHGTATVFNDEMESKAFAWLGMNKTPLNSFKGYWGHTLGAAGIIEIIASVYSLKNNELYQSLGFENTGTPESLNVIADYQQIQVNKVLKTASGFGGCNAATVLEKI